MLSLPFSSWRLSIRHLVHTRPPSEGVRIAAAGEAVTLYLKLFSRSVVSSSSLSLGPNQIYFRL